MNREEFEKANAERRKNGRKKKEISHQQKPQITDTNNTKNKLIKLGIELMKEREKATKTQFRDVQKSVIKL